MCFPGSKFLVNKTSKKKNCNPIVDDRLQLSPFTGMFVRISPVNFNMSLQSRLLDYSAKVHIYNELTKNFLDI